MSQLHVDLSMPIVAILLVLFFASSATAQAQLEELTPGKQRLKEVMEFQAQLKEGNASLSDVREKWMAAAKDPIVRKEKDALAIAYASRATVERDLGNIETADSLFTLAMPLFELKASKAFFLLSQAHLKKLNDKVEGAIKLYGELATEFDSLPQLANIKFYAKSGYPELAYAIDACRNITLLASRFPKHRAIAISHLNQVLRKHPKDQLGLMALLGLIRLDEKNKASHEAKKAKLVENREGFDVLAVEFAKQFN